MERYVKKLLEFYGTHKRMPSYSELMSLTGYRTKSAVHYFLEKLIEEGIVGTGPAASSPDGSTGR